MFSRFCGKPIYSSPYTYHYKIKNFQADLVTLQNKTINKNKKDNFNYGKCLNIFSHPTLANHFTFNASLRRQQTMYLNTRVFLIRNQANDQLVKFLKLSGHFTRKSFLKSSAKTFKSLNKIYRASFRKAWQNDKNNTRKVAQ